jgi:hypothetical protein
MKDISKIKNLRKSTKIIVIKKAIDTFKEDIGCIGMCCVINHALKYLDYKNLEDGYLDIYRLFPEMKIITEKLYDIYNNVWWFNIDDSTTRDKRLNVLNHLLKYYRGEIDIEKLTKIKVSTANEVERTAK